MPCAVRRSWCEARLIRSTGKLRQVDDDFAGGLRRVDVEDDAALAAHRADRRNVLDDPDLVVHVHDGNEDGVRAQRRLHLVEVEQAVFLNVEISHLEALALELAHRVEHCLVLGLDRDQMLAARLIELRGALQGQVVGFSGTRSPDDLARIGVDECGYFLARLLDRRFRFPAPGVAARRRVAEVLAQPGNHRVDDALIHRRRRTVVHVDREMRGHVHGDGGLTSRRPRPERTPSSGR